MSDPIPHLEQLARDQVWTAALARRLVADADLADDLSQETWLLALAAQRPPVAIRAWWSTLMRRAETSLWRKRERRRRRERLAPSPGPSPCPAELAARVDEQRALGEAVVRLPSPFRDVILLRFFEEKSPAEIAAQLEIPLNTVYTRQARALERLRVELERRHGGDGRAWVVALGSLASASAAGGAITGWLGGALIMKTKLAAVAIALATVLSTPWWWGAWEMATEPVARADVVAVGERSELGSPQPGPTSSTATTDRAEIVVDADRSEEVSPGRHSGRALQLRVVDEGQPVAGAQVYALLDENWWGTREYARGQLLGRELTAGRTWLGTTDPSGEYLLADADRPFGLMATHGRGLGSATTQDLVDDELVIELRPVYEIPIRVVDRRGHPVAGVPVGLERDSFSFPRLLRRGTTDRTGLARVSYWGGLQQRLRAALAFPQLAFVSRALDPQDPERELVLECPDFGTVEVIIDGMSADFEADAIVSLWTRGHEGNALGSGASHQVLRGGRALFSPVELGVKLTATVAMRWDQLSLSVAGIAPQRVGETTTLRIDGRGHLRQLKGRVVQPDGEPWTDQLWICPQRSVDVPILFAEGGRRVELADNGEFQVEFADYVARPLGSIVELATIPQLDPRTPIEVAIPRWTRGERDVDLGECVIDRERPLIRGRIVGRDGEIGRRFQVLLARRSDAASGPPDGWEPCLQTWSNPDGTFQIFGDQVPDGAYVVCNSLDEHRQLRHEPVAVEEGDEVRLVLTGL